MRGSRNHVMDLRHRLWKREGVLAQRSRKVGIRLMKVNACEGF